MTRQSSSQRSTPAPADDLASPSAFLLSTSGEAREIELGEGERGLEMRIQGGKEEAAPPPQHLVVRHLIATGHDVHVVTGAPEFVFTTEIKSPNLHIRKVLLDCGAVQADALKADLVMSFLWRAGWLQMLAFVRWDFIYAEYVVAAGNHHRSIVWQICWDLVFGMFGTIILTWKLTEKSNVYEFGVVLLELLMGRRSVEKMSPSQCQSTVIWHDVCCGTLSVFVVTMSTLAVPLEESAEMCQPSNSLANMPIFIAVNTEVIVVPRKQQLTANLRNGKAYMRNEDLDMAVREFKTTLDLAMSIGDHFEQKKAVRGSFLPDNEYHSFFSLF
ncbi:hypothetical protein ABZP36_011353 [Zizania latifolia]